MASPAKKELLCKRFRNPEDLLTSVKQPAGYGTGLRGMQITLDGLVDSP
jgi:hypothetical protein